MENRGINIRMIPIDELINTLVELYNIGVDYIDIVGIPGEKQDNMAISFTAEYMSEEAKESFDEDISEEIIKTKLSEEDLDQLI